MSNAVDPVAVGRGVANAPGRWQVGRPHRVARRWLCGLVNFYNVILESFRSAARDLIRYRLRGDVMLLRREGDSDDPSTWHLVRTVRHTDFSSSRDPGVQGVKLLTVSFQGGMSELVLNQTDQVEFAVVQVPGL